MRFGCINYNGFSGPFPDFEGLKSLEVLSLRVKTLSLVSLISLKVVSLTN
jgi:hypothetical protein